MRKKLVILNATGSLSGSLFDEPSENICYTNVNNQENVVLVSVKKRGRKKKSKIYFTTDTEDAIVRYNNTVNPSVKSQIYTDEIKYSFDKLVENIINTFNFSYIDISYKDLKSEVISHMLLNIHKYDQSKGKAFSYFSIVAKNYLIIANNESYATKKVTKSIDSNEESDTFDFDIIDESYDEGVKDEELTEFMKLMVEYWNDNIEVIFKKRRDVEIAFALNELFRNVKSLDYFNKKSLYCLIREMTGHKTQNITRVIGKMMSHYKIIKDMYYTSGKIEGNAIFYKKK